MPDALGCQEATNWDGLSADDEFGYFQDFTGVRVVWHNRATECAAQIVQLRRWHWRHDIVGDADAEQEQDVRKDDNADNDDVLSFVSAFGVPTPNAKAKKSYSITRP